MEKLIELLMSAKLDKKPTVDELAKLAGVEKVTAAERDEAWAAFEKATGKESGKDDKPAYRVTVKRDGFRRLNRAWAGTTELKKSELPAKDLAVLKADPMFVVVEL